MSRLFIKNQRGREPLLSTPRLLKTKDIADDTYQEPTSRRQKSRKAASYAAKIQQAKRRRKATTPSTASSDDSDAEDASDEQSEDEDDADDDLPAVTAPSRNILAETGLMSRGSFFDNASIAGSVDSMFNDHDAEHALVEDPNLSPEENMKRFEQKLFHDNSDNDSYRGVDDISDSDEDALHQSEEQQLIAGLSEDELQVDYLNQIDGLSAYGFGDESDATVQYPPSSHGSDSATEPPTARRVHFDMDPPNAYHPSLSQSPTISRALLPSALPELAGVYGGPASVSTLLGKEPSSDDTYDSDATDDYLPPEAAIMSTPTNAQSRAESAKATPKSPSPKPATKKNTQRKGPPRGIFIDEGEKASGILDPTGKMIIISRPHLLGKEFAERYGDSTASSPAHAFEDILDGSDAASIQDFGTIGPTSSTDIMLATLNAASVDANGQLIGPQETFYPASDFQFTDFALDGDDFDMALAQSNSLGEDIINMDDVIKFDDDSNDSDSPTSPIFMPPQPFADLASSSFSHLTNENVTAFRRNADPSLATLNTTPTFSRFSEYNTPQQNRTARKRKRRESPYSSSHYKGVTPVQRIRDPNQQSLPSTPDSAPRTKRSRLMTA